MTTAKKFLASLIIVLGNGGMFATCMNSASATPANDAYLKAHALNAQSKFAEALPLLDQAIELDPRLTDAYISRSFSYGKLGQIQKALKDVQKALEIDSNNEVAYNNRGFLFLRLGQYDKAISDFSKAVALNPDDEAAWANRAEAYWRAGDADDALTDCSKAIGFGLGDADPYITRGDILASQGESLRAISDYDTAIGYHPTTANSFHEPGEVYFKRAQQRHLLETKDISEAKNIGYPVEMAETINAFKNKLKKSNTTADLSTSLQSAVNRKQIDSCSVIDEKTVEIQLKNPCSARLVSKLIGWNSPYLVSPDVHQTTWEIQVPRDRMGKIEGSRIATTYPQIGAWTVRASVDGRPTGELPETVAGASPAYNLAIYDSGITTVRLVLENR
ncbi:MAG: tetratricopeptide repeat protein [Candidatus Obscuribacterales bacterium]